MSVQTLETVQGPGIFEEDLYRDIHKAIRGALFGVTADAGRTEPGDEDARRALADRVEDLVRLLDSHSEHEDAHVQPILEADLPELAARIEPMHVELTARSHQIVDLAWDAAHAPRGQERIRLHELYLDLADFTHRYLGHIDTEERLVMPALDALMGIGALREVHHAIVSSIPPEEMAASMALMLPAMNLDDRAEMLGGMQQGAPAEVFSGVWGLTTSILEPADLAALGRRLGVV